VPELAVLLREHVVPALVERRVVSREERVVVAEPSNAAPPPRQAAPGPGTVSVRATPPAATPPEPAGQRPAHRSEPTVQLHIDRVVVTRAPAPTPPPAPVPRPPRRTVDHAAYLARRRERP
jgi:hypothetical protein